jgi:hypothetical protein
MHRVANTKECRWKCAFSGGDGLRKWGKKLSSETKFCAVDVITSKGNVQASEKYRIKRKCLLGGSLSHTL